MQVKSLKLGITATLLLAFFGMGTLRAQSTLVDPKDACTDTLLKHVQQLSSERYGGRLSGTKAYMDACQYVINELSSYGVKPYRGEWLQYFEIECNEVEEASLFTHSMRDNATKKYVLGTDYVCASMTGSGYTNSQAAFCGYGIDDDSYNEYKAMDVKGKVVIVVSGIPNFVDAQIGERYASIRDKARTAQKHGAHALVVVNMSETCGPDEVQLRTYIGDGPHTAEFPILFVTKNTASELFDNEPRSFEECLSALQSEHTMQSFLMDKKLEIDVTAHYNPKAITANVVGYIPGWEAPMKNEYVVVGCHLDHVGEQGNTCMFPGADDNASGVAAVLECARLMSQQQVEPAKRGVMFVFFGGGESQSLGSRVFLSNIKPLSAIEAFLNPECIGTGDSIAVMGNKNFPLIYKLAEAQDTMSTKMMVHGFETSPRGDATAFAHIGIPSLNISTLNGNKHVHTTADIVEDIDPKMITTCATLLFRTAKELSWGDYQGRSRRSKAYKF